MVVSVGPATGKYSNDYFPKNPLIVNNIFDLGTERPSR